MGRIMRWSRTALFAALLGASVLGTSANAYAYDGCGERVRHAEIRLHEAIRRHGVKAARRTSGVVNWSGHAPAAAWITAAMVMGARSRY